MKLDLSGMRDATFSFLKKQFLLWQQLSHQLLCLVPLHLQLVCSLSDQILQVGAILLQHSQHGVDDICPFAPVDAPELQTAKQDTAQSVL